MTQKSLVLAFAGIIVSGIFAFPAPPCNANCILPECRCSGPDIPGNLTTSQVPQLVFLTFDDAVSQDNFYFYNDVFSSRKNPNGQPVTCTFFVSHEYTNYGMVHELYRLGHEVALHSITHSYPTDYWTVLSKTGWIQEFVEQRDQMAYFAKIPKQEIRGMRAPFLQGGGDAMYGALVDGGFMWESTRGTRNIALWPYTNDYASSQECEIPPCHTESFPEFWTVPMVKSIGGDGRPCAMVDACTPLPNTAEKTLYFLKTNFLEHYKTTRAPFGVFTHAAWLNGTGSEEIWQRRLGYIQFLDYLGSLKDVYIVGISRALEWIKNPTSTEKIIDFKPFRVEFKESKCPRIYNCPYRPNGGTERYVRSCVPCPPNFPWLGNPLGA